MQPHHTTFQAMGSPCQLLIYADSTAQASALSRAAQAAVARLEQRYSRYRTDSVLSHINRSAGDPAGIEVDAETAALLDYAATCYAQSDGLFDVTAGVLRRIWDFRQPRLRLPEAAELAAVQALVGWDKLVWRKPWLHLPLAGMELDFGGIVKEYAADALATLYRQAGITHGLIDLGGDLHALGPHPDGQAWQVGIRHPRLPDALLGQLALHRGGLASSGDYARCFLLDGQRYAHILNPKTGWPVRGLASASVMAEFCVIAGSASTIAMLHGEQGAEWLAALGLPYLAMRENGTVVAL